MKNYCDNREFHYCISFHLLFLYFFISTLQLCEIDDKDVITRAFAILGNMALNFHIRPAIGFMGGMKVISGIVNFHY